ncbi:hypothetical protein AGDE_00257 [Angomonas deanei]|uniref:Rab-GTPase-TBC domain containing protein, putative n=1 Tax=Angomonas deanei TaxID=59799 RepID=A0A7G2CS16_9TRYP|nr:hypothetical protein AGDE_00257 [Angomonas deanei]CAD2221967.1 Rab-GTPase-TBC domain containing protein, putative [Angomonas deanei]|eukprot:EPY43664.1 hypothetical protein AGDE_00257 [Angomonas deanei]
MENTFSVKVWHETLAASREKWQKLVSATFDKYKSELIKGPHRGEDSADSKCGLPSTADLYDCLLEGVNADSTAEILQKYNQSHLIAGIEKTGLLTNFKPHVHIFSYYHNLVPSMKQLRRYFEDLAPEKLSCSSYDHLGASLEQFETQMDYFLRAGESVLSLRNNLLEGVHPSLRRLVYARALQIPLSVTDGTPLIPAQGDITNNHFSTASLAAYLSFATRYSRDKVHRRHQHHYSSSHHELNAKTLQRLVVNDVVEYIGDSDKYFVYEDEVKVLLQAMVADKSVPDSKIRDTLTQLGRPKDSLDSYAVYLLGREGDLIHQRAPPCGYIPVAGSSMTCGPLGNITGDTVEQYELLTAMNAQLWFRLQGPTPELLQCCIMFEEIIIQTALPASLHMRRTLKVSPLHLALEWFATGFAELLDPSELLSLWDIVLAYHVQEMSERCCLSQTVGLISLTDDDEGTSSTPCALWVLSLLAAAVFTFRAPIIEKCTTKAEIKSLFATGSQLLVRPLLQYLLFGCELEQ